MCTSRRRQRPTARRLHHAWWFRRSRPASCATSATGGVSPLPRPEDHSNRQATRTSRRARALLREDRLAGALGLASSSSPARRELPTGAPRRLARRRVRPPRGGGRPGRWTAPLPRGSALSNGTRTSSRVKAGHPVLSGVTAEFALVNPPPHLRRIPAGPAHRSWPPQHPGPGPCGKHRRCLSILVAGPGAGLEPFLRVPPEKRPPENQPILSRRSAARLHAASTRAARRQHTGSTPPARRQHATCAGAE
jgi:hypothetical protein